MNGSDCMDILDKMGGMYRGKEMTPRQEELILEGQFYFDDDGAICIFED